MSGLRFGIRQVEIHGFRSARSVTIAPGAICALVGGANVGKSNVLAAIWTLLEQGAPSPSALDISADLVHLRATLTDGEEITLEAGPPERSLRRGRSIPVVFLPAAERSGTFLVQPGGSRPVADSYFAAAVEADAAKARGSTALVAALEGLCTARESGLVLLIEEPELFLAPQAQRYLYRLLRTFAELGNQVLYSTYSPAFLNVGRLDELALVEHSAAAGTTIVQPEPLDADESFRALSELDAERAELFLARAVLLVEGLTEKLTFPFIFRALGHDADREGITIVECGGKPNLVLFIRICEAVQIPYVVVHDRDAPADKEPIEGERVLNAMILELAGPERTVVLERDFEAVAGLRGHSHKPAHAWKRFSSIEPDDIPAPLRLTVARIVELARR